MTLGGRLYRGKVRADRLILRLKRTGPGNEPCPAGLDEIFRTVARRHFSTDGGANPSAPKQWVVLAGVVREVRRMLISPLARPPETGSVRAEPAHAGPDNRCACFSDHRPGHAIYRFRMGAMIGQRSSDGYTADVSQGVRDGNPDRSVIVHGLSTAPDHGLCIMNE